MNRQIDISIVIPLYNERKSVCPLYEVIVESMESLRYQYEILLIDDGSTDDTFKYALEVASQDTRLRVIKLRKNFGQTAALYAGFKHAAGNVIVTMDGDLQNDPKDIGRLMEKMQEGYDLVIGWRENRKDRFFSRKLPSRIANWLIRQVTGASIIDNGCALRAFRADVIKGLPLYSEMHRLLPTLLELAGVRIAQIEVRHHPRKYGQSKYGLTRVYKVLFDLIALKTVMTSASLPMFGFGTFSALSALLSIVALGIGLARGILDTEQLPIVYLGTSMLFGALSVSLLMFGMLCTLIYARGSFKVEDLLKVNSY